MRTKIVAGNWKMNKTQNAAIELISGVLNKISDTKLREDVKIIFSPPYLYIKEISAICDNINYHSCAQNCHHEEFGAYTGEISAGMLKSVGCNYVIVGHSERRAYFNESNDLLKQKVNSALNNSLNIIFCIGEKLEERKSLTHFKVVKQQIEQSLFHLSTVQFENIVLAYEPVWAIGTGETATTAQAQEMHAFIREFVASKYGHEIAQNTSILYGGSCNASNASELFACEDVDGGLIGGASLKIEDFVSIIKAI